MLPYFSNQTSDYWVESPLEAVWCCTRDKLARGLEASFCSLSASRGLFWAQTSRRGREGGGLGGVARFVGTTHPLRSRQVFGAATAVCIIFYRVPLLKLVCVMGDMLASLNDRSVSCCFFWASNIGFGFRIVYKRARTGERGSHGQRREGGGATPVHGSSQNH